MPEAARLPVNGLAITLYLRGLYRLRFGVREFDPRYLILSTNHVQLIQGESAVGGIPR